MKIPSREIPHEVRVENYYRFHSRIYDATRWSFLFGRQKLLSKLPDLPQYPHILEVGCGTGKNIQLLEYLFPDAKIYGIDLSGAMLRKARQKTNGAGQITLINKRYGSEKVDLEPFDLILLSYSLTMTGDQTDTVLQQIYEDLKPKGYVAVVDFHSTPFSWFQSWMQSNHVMMNGQLLPLLNKYYASTYSSVHNAYLGLWQYFTFLGKRG